jgi:Zn-dependent protease with chaperone function
MEGTFNTAVLSLAWFAAVNAAASAAVWTLVRVAGEESLERRPSLLLSLRLLPSAASILFVTLVFMPAHWRFEPRGVSETFGSMVYALALLGAFVVGRSMLRAVSVAHAGWKLRACAALPRIASPDAGRTAVYEVPGLAGVSLAGVVRPRILVGPAVREALTTPELDAAVAHEVAHRASRDNMKRFAMFCAPDFLGRSRVAQLIESQWRAVAEQQADARAVAGDGVRAVHLASALVKVARLAGASPGGMSPAWSSLHEPPLLETRVKRLVAGDALRPAESHGGRAAALLVAGMWATAVAGAAAGAELHQLTETLSHLLP